MIVPLSSASYKAINHFISFRRLAYKHFLFFRCFFCLLSLSFSLVCIRDSPESNCRHLLLHDWLILWPMIEVIALLLTSGSWAGLRASRDLRRDHHRMWRTWPGCTWSWNGELELLDWARVGSPRERSVPFLPDLKALHENETQNPILKRRFPYQFRFLSECKPNLSVISAAFIAFGRSCLLARMSKTASRSSSSANIRMSSSFASPENRNVS